MIPFAEIGYYLKTFRKYIGRRLYIVFALTIAAAIAEGLGISLLLPLLKQIEGEGAEPGSYPEQVLQGFLESVGLAESLVGILAIIGGLFLLKGVLKFAEEGYRGVLQAKLLRRLKLRMFDAYSAMKYPYYLSRDTGYFINIINAQVGQLYQCFHAFSTFLSRLILAVAYLGFAFLISWKFALMATAIGLFLVALFKYLSAYVRELSRKRSAEMGHLNKLLVQVLQGFKYITSTGQKGHLRGGIQESTGRLAVYERKTQIAQAFTKSVREPIAVLVIIGIIAIQVYWFQASLIPIFVAILLFYKGLSSLMQVQGLWQRAMSLTGGLELTDSEFRRLADSKEADGAVEIGAFSESIDLQNVAFAYQDEPVLKGISLSIRKNQTVAMVGESGAGKSTLIDLMTLLLKPTGGSLRIDGVPWEDIKLESWRRQIGYVSQETVVFDDTIANNISLWEPENDFGTLEARIREAARKAHLAEFIETLDEGYETMVGDRGIRLSGGQRQRLFIARELFKEPNFLILDEATSALDTESEKLVQKSIDELRGQTTVVIIAHRLSTIRNVDNVFVLASGRLVEQGPYEELRNRETSRFRNMVELQSL